jgi:hemolysin type calcium-binding protein
MTRAFLVAVLLLLGFAAAAEAAPRVVVTGDSLVQPLDELMVRPISRAGGRVIKDPRPGTSLTRPLIFDWLKHARRQVRKHRPHATVMFIGAGDTGSMTTAGGRSVPCCQRAWIDAYADLVERMMRTYMRRKRHDVYWLTLPMPRQDDRRQQFLAINYAIAQAARKAGSKAHVVDTVPVLTPGSRFHRKLRYRGESVVVRDGDGVHLTKNGARIVRDLVLRAMRSDGALRPRARAAATAGTAALAYEGPLPELEIGAAYALSVEAGRAAANRIAVVESTDAFVVTDARTPLRPGQGCVAVTAQTVRCPTPRAVTDRSVFVDARGSGDEVSLTGVSLGTLAEARGGGGRDLLYGSAGGDLLDGGDGRDGLAGGDGDDLLDGGAGDDTAVGGDGQDTLSYQRRTRPVTVDLARHRGGGRGERDAVFDVEIVIGSTAADVLRGTNAADSLHGGEGRAHDRVEGRAGDDALIGYRAIGGRGDDVVDGRDPSCGRGSDGVFIRPGRSGLGPFPRACEQVITLYVVLRPRENVSSERRAVFGMRCRKPGPCRGALTLRDARGVVGRKRFELRQPDASERFHPVRIRFARRPAQRVATLHVSGVRAYHASDIRVRLR